MRVVHLIPRDGLGGVESAARSFAEHGHSVIGVWFMAGLSLSESRHVRSLSPEFSLNSFAVYWQALRALWVATPDVLVVSLWRARLVGIFYKILRPKVRLVSMVHSTRFAHFLDRWVTRISVGLAEEIWFDSQAAKIAFPGGRSKKQRVISFFVRVADTPVGEMLRSIDFVYWGRLAPGKDLPRAISIFSKVRRRYGSGSFYIYGPEDGGSEEIQAAIAASHCASSIFLMGEKPPGRFPDPIRSCTFFLMTSRAEGMAVSVVEAMQLGLIPVVTPVGEIPNYCTEASALFIRDDETAIDEIYNLLGDLEKANNMREAAQSVWRVQSDYRTDFINACLDMLHPAGNRADVL